MSDTTLSLSQLFDEFMRWAPVRRSTKKKCRSAWLQWRAFCEAVPEASAGKFQMYLRDRVAMPLTSVQSYTAAVSQVYRWLCEQGGEYGVGVNPFHGIKRIRPGWRRVEVFTMAELQAMFEASGRMPWRDPVRRMRWAGFFLVGLHGLREGEIWNLRWGYDIDLDENILRVQCRGTDAAAGFWEWGSKTDADREVPMSADLVGFLQRFAIVSTHLYPFLKAETYRTRMAQAWPLPEEARNYPYCNFWAEFNAIRRSAQIKAGTFHRLRKNAGTHLAEQRVPMAHARNILGHESIQTTERYYVAVDRQLAMANARNAFDRIPLGPVGFEPTTKGL